MTIDNSSKRQPFRNELLTTKNSRNFIIDKKRENFQIRKGTFCDINSLEYMMNSVIKILLDKGIHQWDYPCERKSLEEDVKNGFIFVFKKNNEVRGCFSIR